MRGEAPARKQIAGERSKREREREDSPLTEEEKQNTGESNKRLLKLLESGVLFRFPEKTRFRILPRGWLVGLWPEVMSSIENAFAGYSLTSPSIYSSAIFDANCQPLWIIIGCPQITRISCMNCHVRQNTDHMKDDILPYSVKSKCLSLGKQTALIPPPSFDLKEEKNIISFQQFPSTFLSIQWQCWSVQLL